MVYDKHRSGPADFSDTGLTAEHIAQFCSEYGVDFHARGEPGNWDSPHVFRVATQTYPAQGRTVVFAQVREWLTVREANEARVVEGARYRHYKGGFYTVVCEALEEATGKPVVVYRGEDGRTWTRPTRDFLSIFEGEDKRLVARFTRVAAA